MNAFAAATQALVRDPNMGEAADWRAAPGDAPTPLRVVRTKPDATLELRAGVVLPTHVLLVPLADLTAPVRGGTFTLGGEVLTVMTAERDSVHAAWRVECRR